MKKILVSGASSIVGLGILKSLKKTKKEYKIIGTTCFDDTVVPAFCDVFEKAPLTNDQNYIDWLLAIIKKHDIDLIIPGIDADMYKWSENRDEIEKGKLKLLINKDDIITLCKDKWSFFEKLVKDVEEYIIPSSLSNDFEALKKKYGIPMLLKPRHGFGSKGIVKIFDKETFLQNKDEIGKNLLVQPLIGNDDEEYTTSAFCDGEGGYFACMSLKRKLSKDGYTEMAEVVDIPGVEKVISSFCEILKPIGPTNFQFRLYNGRLKLLEINPRISSSTSIRSSFGYNESLMAVDYFLDNLKPTKPNLKKGRAVRYIEDCIFYK